MKRILIVKVSSLGDVVQAQPIVQDLRRAFPGVVVDWATDTDFAVIPAWNHGVNRVHSAPLRQFKKTRAPRDLRRIVQSVRKLRLDRYDAVLDIHGVYKSAIIAFLARSPKRFGYAREALGETGAAFAYTDRFEKLHGQTVIDGLRHSVGKALNYRLDSPPCFGLTLPGDVVSNANASWNRTGKPLVLLFHASSKPAKAWPREHWIELANAFTKRGMVAAMPWGNESERLEAQAIAARARAAVVLPRMTLTEAAGVVASASLVVGVDTGLVHLAHALGAPTVMIFTATSRRHFGVDCPGKAVSVGDTGMCPSVEEVVFAARSVSDRGLNIVNARAGSQW